MLPGVQVTGVHDIIFFLHASGMFNVCEAGLDCMLYRPSYVLIGICESLVGW